jgi:hypothetical protein
MGEERGAYRVFVEQLGRSGRRLEDNIKMGFREIG